MHLNLKTLPAILKSSAQENIMLCEKFLKKKSKEGILENVTHLMSF